MLACVTTNCPLPATIDVVAMSFAASGVIGENATKLLSLGGTYEFDIARQVRLTDERFELHLLDARGTVVTIELTDDAHRRLPNRRSSN